MPADVLVTLGRGGTVGRLGGCPFNNAEAHGKSSCQMDSSVLIEMSLLGVVDSDNEGMVSEGAMSKDGKLRGKSGLK